MDSKAPLLPQTEASAEETMPRRSAARRFSRLYIVAILGVFTLFWMAMRWQCADPSHSNEDREAAKVPLEIHIMSKCPDARQCLKEFVVPTMANVSDKVDFRVAYIGKPTDHDDGVECPHGQTECLGNIMELCAASEYPDPKIYLGFTLCLSLKYQDIPKEALARDCALEYGIDFNKLNDCMSRDDGAYGMGMLRNSVKRSADLGVKKSCTVRLNEKMRCVVDGGEYKDCDGGSKPEDLIRDVEKLYRQSASGNGL